MTKTPYTQVRIMIFELVLLWLFRYSQGDSVLSVFDLRNYLNMKDSLVMEVENLITDKTTGLDSTLQDALTRLQKLPRATADDADDFLGHPVNVYSLISGLTIFAKALESNRNTLTICGCLLGWATSFSNEEDLKGVNAALLRLQDVYNMTTEQIVAGDFYGITGRYQLTSYDCFQLGKMAYKRNDAYHAMLWLNGSLNVAATEATPTADLVQVLDYYAYAMYGKNNVPDAYKLTKELLQLNADHQSKQNISYYQEMVLYMRQREKNEFQNYYEPIKIHEGYEALCKMGLLNSMPPRSDVYCTLRQTEALFYLAPLKEEYLNIDPLVVLYHDVMTNEEIDVVKTEAESNMIVPPVNEPKDPRKSARKSSFDVRTGHTAWVGDNRPTIEVLSHKVAELSGLDLVSAERVQVVNYGVGGHYIPHYDFVSDSEAKSRYVIENGDRIATVLCYLQDVPAGGYTVFTETKTVVKPEKGACALWYNLKKSGDHDGEALHASCPVLVGTKWITNKWFHENGQEFKRPCGLWEHD